MMKNLQVNKENNHRWTHIHIDQWHWIQVHPTHIVVYVAHRFHNIQ